MDGVLYLVLEERGSNDGGECQEHRNGAFIHK